MKKYIKSSESNPVELTDREIQVLISTYVIGDMQDKAKESVLRDIIFNGDLDWQQIYYDIILPTMPELYSKSYLDKMLNKF